MLAFALWLVASMETSAIKLDVADWKRCRERTGQGKGIPVTHSLEGLSGYDPHMDEERDGHEHMVQRRRTLEAQSDEG
jgi:hypothetical protein